MKETVADTGKQLPGQIAWTDDKGEEHLVKQVSHDSVTGENMTLIELSEVTVMAKSKQVAERNGKINLDFLVTVPGELINNKWQFKLGCPAVSGNLCTAAAIGSNRNLNKEEYDVSLSHFSDPRP